MLHSVLVCLSLAFADSDDPNFKDAPIRKPAKVEGDPRFLHPDGVSNAAYSPNGKYLVTVSPTADHRLWDAQTGKLLRRFDVYGGIRRPVFSPDSRKLYAGNGELRIMDVETGELEHKILVGPWTLSHDGKTLISLHLRPSKQQDRLPIARWDGFEVKLRDATGKELQTFPKIDGMPHGVTLSRDGGTLAVLWSGAKSRNVAIYDLTAKVPGERNHFVPKGVGDHFALRGYPESQKTQRFDRVFRPKTPLSG